VGLSENGSANQHNFVPKMFSDLASVQPVTEKNPRFEQVISPIYKFKMLINNEI